LCGKDGIEREGSNEAVQNDLIIDFLQRGKDAREGPEEVIENLFR
jgi:hypothetical protein